MEKSLFLLNDRENKCVARPKEGDRISHQDLAPAVQVSTGIVVNRESLSCLLTLGAKTIKSYGITSRGRGIITIQSMFMFCLKFSTHD